jgi:hypothetical protein
MSGGGTWSGPRDPGAHHTGLTRSLDADEAEPPAGDVGPLHTGLTKPWEADLPDEPECLGAPPVPEPPRRWPAHPPTCVVAPTGEDDVKTVSIDAAAWRAPQPPPVGGGTLAPAPDDGGGPTVHLQVPAPGDEDGAEPTRHISLDEAQQVQALDAPRAEELLLARLRSGHGAEALAIAGNLSHAARRGLDDRIGYLRAAAHLLEAKHLLAGVGYTKLPRAWREQYARLHAALEDLDPLPPAR